MFVCVAIVDNQVLGGSKRCSGHLDNLPHNSILLLHQHAFEV